MTKPSHPRRYRNVAARSGARPRSGLVGLVAKVVALEAVVVGGLWPLAVVAVVGAVLGVAVYLRWVTVLLGAGRAVRPLQRMPGSRLGLLLAGAALVVTSVVPALVLR